MVCAGGGNAARGEQGLPGCGDGLFLVADHFVEQQDDLQGICGIGGDGVKQRGQGGVAGLGAGGAGRWRWR